MGLENAMFVQRLELKWVRLEEDSQPTEEENKNSGKGDKYFSYGLLHGIPALLKTCCLVSRCIQYSREGERVNKRDFLDNSLNLL